MHLQLYMVPSLVLTSQLDVSFGDVKRQTPVLERKCVMNANLVMNANASPAASRVGGPTPSPFSFMQTLSLDRGDLTP